MNSELSSSNSQEAILSVASAGQNRNFNISSSGSAEGALLIHSVIYEHLKSMVLAENYEPDLKKHLTALQVKEKAVRDMDISILSMLRCQKETGIKLIKHCTGCGDFKLVPLVYHCSLSSCEFCSNIRQRRNLKRFLPHVQNFSCARGAPEKLYFLTISPKNYSSLKEGLKHIRASWKKFLRLGYISERVKGGIWVIEDKNKNKFGECKGWNVHIHAIFYGRRLDNVIRGKCLDCSQSYIKHEKNSDAYYCANKNCKSTNLIRNEDSKLVSLWKKTTGSGAMIDITEIKHGPKGALSYVLKYLSADKSDFSDEKAFAEHIFYTRKRKAINAFGIFDAHSDEFKKIGVTKTCFCNKCGGILEFIFDFEVVAMLEDSMRRPPDPPNLLDYTS